jgi:hypothetical protein
LCGISLPLYLCSFPCRFLCLSYANLGNRQPKYCYWLEHTALQWFVVKGPACGFWIPPANNMSPKGKLASTLTACSMIDIMSCASLQ